MEILLIIEIDESGTYSLTLAITQSLLTINSITQCFRLKEAQASGTKESETDKIQ